ncbi:hypothetical protein ACJJIW_11685 [Microbulbifer sp. JMSA004]|uniref:hypothetical protein n=1 Tax=unclassified Microbulbifer TaxID=2619833 RepID=UPI0024ACE9F5|nr:hypothetical protein [Microbulbifer sp. VAAF005]WHI45959.1 hypothetical protein P0078_19905 [Microbulbifer sp. VAAF005]
MTTETNFIELAREQRKNLRTNLENLPEDVQKEFSIASAEYAFSGDLAIIVSGIGYTHVVMTLTFESGEVLRFEGNGGGLIIGAGGVSYGGGVSSLSPAQLITKGDMHFLFQTTLVGTILEFGGVGSFVGGGPNIASGTAAGSGKFTKQ